MDGSNRDSPNSRGHRRTHSIPYFQFEDDQSKEEGTSAQMESVLRPYARSSWLAAPPVRHHNSNRERPESMISTMSQDSSSQLSVHSLPWPRSRSRSRSHSRSSSRSASHGERSSSVHLSPRGSRYQDAFDYEDSYINSRVGEEELVELKEDLKSAIGNGGHTGSWLAPTGPKPAPRSHNSSKVSLLSGSEVYELEDMEYKTPIRPTLRVDIPQDVEEQPVYTPRPDTVEGVFREFTSKINNIRQQRSPNLRRPTQDIFSDFDQDTESFAPPSPSMASQNHQSQPQPQQVPLILYGKSLNIFPPYSEFRNQTARRIQHPVTYYSIQVLLVLQTAALGYRQWNPSVMHGYMQFGSNWVDWVLLSINIIYTFDIAYKCIAWGFWDDSEMFKAKDLEYVPVMKLLKLDSLKAYFMGKDPQMEEMEKKVFKYSMTFKSTSDQSNIPLQRAFMRSSWNRVDFVSTVCFWINFFLSINRTNATSHVPLFRALECLRIIRVVNVTDRISLLLKSIKHGAPQLLDVSLFILYFWLLFAVIGTQSFKSSYRRYCVWTNPEDSSDMYQSSQHCGGYLVQNSDGSISKKPFIGAEGSYSPYHKGFLCPVNSQCLELQNPHNNMYSFDNILNAMQLIFVVMSANTFSNIMYDMMNTDTMTASLFFVVAIFVLFLWMMNLLVAVISASFRATREAEIKENNEPKEDFDRSFHMPDSWLSRRYQFVSHVCDILTAVSVAIACVRTNTFSDDSKSLEYLGQSIISGILVAEIIWRFFAYYRQWKMFFKLKRNSFDLFLAVTTGVIAIPSIHTKLGRGYDWMRAFQMLRFYRMVLRFIFVRKLWAKVWRNINIIINLSLFYFLFLFLCSIIFARYFEGFLAPGDIDDYQFPMNTLPNTFLALFVITSTENWTDIMYNMQAAAPNKSAALFGALLFIMWFLISNSIILSIFIAIIGDSLEVSEKLKRKAQVKKFILIDFPKKLKQLAEETVLSGIRDRFFGSADSQEHKHREIEKLLLNGAAVQAFLRDEVEHDVIEDFDVEERTASGNVFMRFFQARYRIAKRSAVGIFIRRVFLLRSSLDNKNPFFNASKFSSDSNYAVLAEKFQIETEKTIDARKKFLKENPNFNTALFILRPNHPMRKLCQKITKPSVGKRYDGVEPNKIVNAIFVGTISAATLVLVIVACYATPLYRNTKGFHEDSLLNWTMIVEGSLGVLFALEFFIKIIADGVWYTPNAYAQNSWNHIDFVVLVSIWVNIFAVIRGDENLSRIVRGLKALRALRILTISETSKDIFHKVLIVGVWKILRAALLAFTLIFPFAAWGLNLYTGRLGACNDGQYGRSDCINEYSETVFNWDIIMPRSYVEPQLELNRFASALLTLFEILSMEGWTDLLQNMVNSTGEGTPMSYYATPGNAVFVVLFLFVGIVFVLTLFISVIIMNYAILSGSAFLTLQQTSWNEVNKLLSQARPRKRPDTRNLSRFRMFCYKYSINRPRWQVIMMHSVLWIHVLAILLEKFPTIEALDNFRYVIFICSSTLFLISIVMRLVALGPKTFFKVRWNVYELFIFSGAFTTSAASFFVSRSTSFANVNKLFLVCIFTILIHQSNRLSHLLKIASASVPSLLSLVFTWAILLLVYAIALNQIFGLTRLGPNTDGNQNLRTVTKAMILLFKISFGEGWNYTMRDFAIESPYCTDSGNFASTDCGNMQYAYILFISWNILSMYIFVNMFVSLIFENFSYVYTDNSGTVTLDREEIRKFKTVWSVFDPDGTGYITLEKLPCFLRSLDGYFAFHMFEGKWSIPELKSNYIGLRKLPDQHGPYDIDVDIHGLNRMLAQLDISKARHRQLQYERFIEEAKFNMERDEDNGISFQRLIVQIPLYARFDENNCLTLTDFLDRLVVSRRLKERLEYRRRLDTLKMISCRWKFLRLTGRKFASMKPIFRNQEFTDDGSDFRSPFFRLDPFMTPRSSISRSRINADDAYWSPAESNGKLGRSGTEVLEELADISGALEHSQWRNEFKSVGTELEQVMSRVDLNDAVSQREKDRDVERAEEKEDDDSNERELWGLGISGYQSGSVSERKIT